MSEAKSIVGIVLAAGCSSRMSRTKQLLPFRGKTLVETVVDTALSSRLDKVVVVLGNEGAAIKEALGLRPVRAVENPYYFSGQSSSIRAGLLAVAEEASAVVFLLADQPLLPAATIDSLIAAYDNGDGPIVIPVNDGRRGTPVLFARETFRSLAQLEGDQGGRQLFDFYRERLCLVPVHDPFLHFDVDTEADYRRLLDESTRAGAKSETSGRGIAVEGK